MWIRNPLEMDTTIGNEHYCSYIEITTPGSNTPAWFSPAPDNFTKWGFRQRFDPCPDADQILNALGFGHEAEASYIEFNRKQHCAT